MQELIYPEDIMFRKIIHQISFEIHKTMYSKSETVMVPEASAIFNQLTWLVIPENFYQRFGNLRNNFSGK
jgi:hypothetical protein